MNGRRRRIRSDDFTAVDRGHMATLASTPGEAQLQVRMLLLALARVDINGHAHFERSELSRLLEGVDKTTGEIVKPSRFAIARARDALIADGYLRDGSWAQCLLLPLFAVQAPHVDGTPCPKRPGGQGAF